MIRKTTLALATLAALATAALAPSSASAHIPGGFGHGFGMAHFGHGFGHGWGRFGWAGAYAGDSCYRSAVVDSPVGPVVRTWYVCY
jgi:hypothetical protein